MTNEEVISFLETSTFKVAKTMPTIPHAYTLKDSCKNPADFIEVVRFIQQNGVQEMFYQKEFTYFYWNGYKYWTMGFPPEETILINRASATPE